ncbi:MAG: hypothetical protein ACT4PW_06685 [Acidimicrobiia bacterium]
MPWCDECAKFWNPGSLSSAGACPRCGLLVAGADRGRSAHPAGGGASPAAPDAGGIDEYDQPDEYKAPWHFKVMVVLCCGYVAWRIVQMVTWAL